MNTMTYKGQTARVDFDERDDIFVGTAVHAVCVVQSVDGAWEIDEVRGMSAPKNRAMALQGVKKARVGGKNSGISGAFA